MNPTTFTALPFSLRIPVVGRARNLGSHMVKHLVRRGWDVVTFDNLSASS